jgi:hypothetical protein
VKRTLSCRIRPRLVRIGALTLAALLVLSSGCSPSSPDRLLVATSWPADACRKLTADFQRWVEASHDHLGHRRVRLEWLTLAAQDDPLKLASRATPPHVILGGRASTFALLASGDRLSPIEHAGQARWCTVARPGGGGLSPAQAARPAWCDPRDDPASLHRAIGQLSAAGWREGYAQLVRMAAGRERIGRSSEGSLFSSSARDAPAAGVANAGTPADLPQAIECAAIARRAPDQDLAQGFMRFLVETQGAKPAANQGEVRTDVPAEVGFLVADLLGSTLVDAQDELWTASRAIERLADRTQALEWLYEPPPWPPASVAKYLGREGERAMALIETLSAEVAPETPARAWLLRSWLAPARSVDQALLSELTHAADGRLCREPRFRAWLREEWTAWARQRYRRVTRWAGSQPNRSGNERISTLP